MFTTWNEAKLYFENIYASVVRESKRVLKKEIPKSISIKEEVKNNLISYYNEFTKNLTLHWHDFDDNQIYVLKNIFSKLRDRVIRSFQVLDVDIKIPNSCTQQIDKNIKELELLVSPGEDIHKSIQKKSENMALTKSEFFNFASKILPSEFDGSPDRLKSLLDALSLLQLNAEGNEDNAVAYVRTRLVGKARDIITDRDSLTDIINKLQTGIKTESSHLIEAQLFAKRLHSTDVSEFTTEMDSLSSRLKRAYINEGVPVDVAEKFATNNVVKALIKTSNSDRVKIIMEASKFATCNDALTKFVNINTEMPTTSVYYSRNQNFAHRPRGRGYPRFQNNNRSTFQNTSRNFQNFNQNRGRNPEGRGFHNYYRFNRGSNQQNNRNVRMYESNIDNDSENQSPPHAGPMGRD